MVKENFKTETSNEKYNSYDSLYSLIKEISQRKNRPLKIVSDWDECLFSFRPSAIHRFGIKKPFKEFFADYWERTIVDSREGSSAHKTFAYDAPEGEEKTAYEKWKELSIEYLKILRKGDDKISTLKEREEYEYSRSMLSNKIDDPFLSFSDDLLKCLKEGLINRLVIISATGSKEIKPSPTAVIKRERFTQSFGKFPQCSLTVMGVWAADGKSKIHRWEWIKENAPDFDIFIDDDKEWIGSVRENFSNNKIYVINDYKTNRDVGGDNVYHIKTTVSDLTDQDFSTVALEMKARQVEKELQIISNEEILPK